MSFIISLSLDINECVSQPCGNNASCLDKLNGFQCACLPGFTGQYCHTGKTVARHGGNRYVCRDTWLFLLTQWTNSTQFGELPSMRAGCQMQASCLGVLTLADSSPPLL